MPDKATVATQGTAGPAPIKAVLCLVILFFVLVLAAAVAVTVYFIIGPEFSGGSRGTDGSDSEGDTMFQGVVGADGAYKMNWTSDSETFTVTIEGRTRGWVGFGISGTGGMREADIMVAWVDDSGTGHILDTHAEQIGAPVNDTFEQDWELLEASEDGEYTRITARRFLRLCDPGNRNVTVNGERTLLVTGTLKLIWALGDSDPASVSSLNSADYHGNRRGTAIRRLLDPAGPPPTLPDDAISVDFEQQNVAIPSDRDTTYWCRLAPVPQTSQKHHFIMFEPVIQKGNEQFVHHMILYVCHVTKDAPQALVAPGGFNCWDGSIRQYQYCSYMVAGWAVGGTAFHFPEHIGVPLMGEGSPTHLLIETHYDNPNLQAGVVDSSGLRMWLTPTLRQYDASLLWTGMLVDNLHIIPAGVENFITTGHCLGECLDRGLADIEGGIHFVAGFLHTHLAGVSVVLRHIRNGTELRPIMEDKTYDFNYQNVILLDEEVTLLPGDRLILECGYTTTDRTQTSYGGEGTFDEMCLAFLYYYPVMSVQRCITVPSVPQLVKSIPGAAIRYDSSTENFYFTAPPELDGLSVFGNVDYLLANLDGAAEALQQVNRDGGIYSICVVDDEFEWSETTVPPVETPYTETVEQCHLGTEDLPDK